MSPTISPTLSQAVSPLFVPFLCLAVAVAVVVTPLPIPVAIDPILPYLAYGTGMLAAVLALRFGQTRILLMAGLVCFAAFILNFGAAGDAALAHFALMVPALSVLVPVNVLALSLCDRRGAVNGCGIAWAFVLAAQGAVVAFIAQGGYGVLTDEDGSALFRNAVAILNFDLLPPLPLSGVSLNDPALVAFALSGLMLIGNLLRSHSAVDGGMLGAVVAVALVLNAPRDALVGQVLTAVAGIILVAAVLQEAWRMAFIDDLTALPGRRALETDLKRLGRRYTAAMLDIDHFKHFNDTYGHDVGDQVLRLVATQIHRVRGGGRAYRYGGEEFTILFPGKKPEQVKQHLEAVRAQVAAQGFILRAQDRPQTKAKGRKRRGRIGGGNEKISVTISIGYAARSGAVNLPADVLKQADQALYRAKKAGRNRVSR